MHSDSLAPLLQWLNANPHWAGFVTFFISAIESVAILGTIIPGSLAMTALGTLAGAGVIPLWETIFWAIMGAIIGDGISYWMGYYFKNRIRGFWPFKQYPNLLNSGEHFFHRYGSMSVFIGRFVGPVRALVPVVAGMLGMRPLQFTIANVLSAIGWAPAYLLPGIILGAASSELPKDVALHVVLMILLLGIFAALLLWIAYKIFLLLHFQIHQLLEKIWSQLKTSRVGLMLTHLLKHYREEKTHGQLSLAFFFLMTILLFLSLLAVCKYFGSSHIEMNQDIWQFLRSLDYLPARKLAIAITLLGQKELIWLLGLACISYFFAIKQYRLAIHSLFLIGLSSLGVALLKFIIHSPRPWGIIGEENNFSFPSGHTTLAVSVYFMLALLFSANKENWFRKFCFLTAFSMSFLVGFSRLYLGAHWFTDILAGWLFGGACLILTLLSYRRQRTPKLNLLPFSIFFFIVFLGSYALVAYQKTPNFMAAYEKIYIRSRSTTMDAWWNSTFKMKLASTRVIGFKSYPIQFLWLAPLDRIETELQNAGWKNPPPRDWISTFHRIADVNSTEYLPMVAPQYLHAYPISTFTQKLESSDKLIVLRLWHSGYTINGKPIFAGIVTLVPRSYHWLNHKQDIAFQINPSILFGIKNNSYWETKFTRHGKSNLILIRKK